MNLENHTNMMILDNVRYVVTFVDGDQVTMLGCFLKRIDFRDVITYRKA